MGPNYLPVLEQISARLGRIQVVLQAMFEVMDRQRRDEEQRLLETAGISQEGILKKGDVEAMLAEVKEKSRFDGFNLAVDGPTPLSAKGE